MASLIIGPVTRCAHERRYDSAVKPNSRQNCSVLELSTVRGNVMSDQSDMVPLRVAELRKFRAVNAVCRDSVLLIRGKNDRKLLA